jgi:hypothetical protein
MVAIVIFIALWSLYNLPNNPFGITLPIIYDFTLTGTLMIFTALQAFIAYLQYSVSNLKDEPYLFAYTNPNPRLVNVENTGGGPAWYCTIKILNNQRKYESITKVLPILYPRAVWSYNIPWDWKDAPEYHLEIAYYLSEKKGKKRSWVGESFKAEFSEPEVSHGQRSN